MPREGIGVLGLSPELVLRFANFGELPNWLTMPILDTDSFILLVGSSVFVTAIIPFYRSMVGRERPSNASVSPDSEY